MYNIARKLANESSTVAPHCSTATDQLNSRLDECHDFERGVGSARTGSDLLFLCPLMFYFTRIQRNQTEFNVKVCILKITREIVGWVVESNLRISHRKGGGRRIAKIASCN